jgi:hypothetical protein
MSALDCLFCGEPERVCVHDVYATGEFELDTCCEGMRDSVAEYLAEDPKVAARWLASLPASDAEEPGIDVGIEHLCGHNLRRVVDNDGQLLLDWQLEVAPIEWRDAKAFVGEHHEHCQEPAGWRFGAAVRNGKQLIGVVTVGRPVARAYDKSKVVEVNRLCVRRDVPRPLVWNACSLLYGWSAREARKRGFERIITYTLETESGVSLRAAGFVPEAQVRARKSGWSTASRPRDADRTPNVNKTRWARELRAA